MLVQRRFRRLFLFPVIVKLMKRWERRREARERARADLRLFLEQQSRHYEAGGLLLDSKARAQAVPMDDALADWLRYRAIPPTETMIRKMEKI